MSKPFSRKTFRRRYIMTALGVYLLIVFSFAHFGYVVTNQKSSASGAQIIQDTLDHIAYHPLQLWPNQPRYLAYGAAVGLFAPLMISSEYARKRDLRPAVESGSAKWNEDYKGFRKQYTTMTPLKEKRKLSSKRADPPFLVVVGYYLANLFYNKVIYPMSVIPSKLRQKPILGEKADNMIMADGIYLSMDGRRTGRNCNVVCIGGAGTGKSYSVIKPNILQANCSMVITDPSGELLESMGCFLQEQGYEVRVFNLVDISYVSRRLQSVTRRAYRNKQALGNASRLARSFLLRPLVAGSESNTEGLYYANRIASDPLTRSGMRIGYRAARWTIRRPFWLAHKIAPKPYEAAAQKVEKAAHAVAAVPKNLVSHAQSGIKKAISNIMPKGVKTGIKRVQSTYAVAKTGIQNAVFRANAWLANTKLGHAATTVRVVGRGAAEALRTAGAALKTVSLKVLLPLGILLLICVAATSFIPNIVAGSAGGVILSPAESTSGKINLAPYCMVYGSEAKRFDNELAALLRKYSDTEKYESVQVHYSDISMNAKEILSMMAVHLQQSLDMDENPDVKSYISYMFRQSHVYSVYEDLYYCEGCEQRPTGELIDKVVMVDGKPVIVDGKPVVTKVPEMEDFCPGHIDVTITVNVYNFDEIFGLDQFPASNDWDGWTQDNKDWCKLIYDMDWNELYEGLEYLSSGSVTGIAGSAYEQQIWNFLMDLIGNEYGAAGLMGNLYCESGLNPTNLQDSYELNLGYNNDTYTAAVDSKAYSESSFVNDSAGYGLAQWTWPTRKQALYTYCTSRGLSIGSIDGQLGYLSTELTGSFSGCLSDLRNAGSVEEGSRIAMLRFEAPLDQSASAQAVRQQYAEYFYNKMVYGVASEGNLTQKQQEVIHIAMNSASYGIAARPGYCQAWAAYVYAKAGLPIDNSSCAYQSGVRFGVSSDFSNVPPGAAVYGYSGSKYGHVGIYVGNGLVYHNIGRVAVDSLSDWISIYKGFCWGWEAGSDLTTYD